MLQSYTFFFYYFFTLKHITIFLVIFMPKGTTICLKIWNRVYSEIYIWSTSFWKNCCKLWLMGKLSCKSPLDSPTNRASSVFRSEKFWVQIHNNSIYGISYSYFEGLLNIAWAVFRNGSCLVDHPVMILVHMSVYL
jgi:hypothetical protein